MTAMRQKRSYNRHPPQPAAQPAPLHHEAGADQPIIQDPSRAEMRQDMRPQMRADDPRARAKARAAVLRDHMPDPDAGVDEFRIDLDTIPDGWTYEWKRHETLGAKDPSYEVSLAQNGWEPVPVSRHPSFMPKDWKGQVIERKGMVLMERPQEITDIVRARDRQNALEPVRGMEAKLAGVAPGQFPRQKSSGEGLVKVGKSYEPMAIPE